MIFLLLFCLFLQEKIDEERKTKHNNNGWSGKKLVRTQTGMSAACKIKMYLKHTSFYYIIPFMPSLYRLTFWNIILLGLRPLVLPLSQTTAPIKYYEVVHILVYLFWDSQCAFCKCTEMNSSNWCYFVPHLKYLLFMADFTSIQIDWRSGNF